MLESFHFCAPARKSAGKGGWTFVTFPDECADQVRFVMSGRKGSGWGMIKAKAIVGTSRWDTTIWPDKGSGSFLLPLKAAIRKREGIREGDLVEVTVELVLPGI